MGKKIIITSIVTIIFICLQGNTVLADFNDEFRVELMNLYEIEVPEYQNYNDWIDNISNYWRNNDIVMYTYMTGNNDSRYKQYYFCGSSNPIKDSNCVNITTPNIYAFFQYDNDYRRWDQCFIFYDVSNLIYSWDEYNIVELGLYNEFLKEYVYNTNIGYLTGIKEKSKFLTIKPSNANEHYIVETDRVFKFGWDSITSTGIDLKSGADITWIKDDNEIFGSISNIQIQSKLHLIGSVRSIWTGKKLRDLPDEGSWHEFDLFNPYDPYNFSFNASDIEEIFSDLIESNTNGITEDVYMQCEFYMRLVGNLSDDDSPPNNSYICGPWVKISFNAWKFGKSDAITDSNIDLIGVRELDENNNDVIDFDSPYGDGQSGEVMSGTGNSAISAENNIANIDASSMVSNLSDFFSQIGNVPKVIALVFSFLPGWALLFFASCFSISCAFLVLKTIRG